MQFNHGESPPEVPEEAEEGVGLEIIIETEPILERKDSVIQEILDDLPQDNYLQKELERQKQEELQKMLPKRIP